MRDDQLAELKAMGLTHDVTFTLQDGATITLAQLCDEVTGAWKCRDEALVLLDKAGDKLEAEAEKKSGN